MPPFSRDLRDARRSLTRSPGFTAAAVATLVLGLAGTAAVFGPARRASRSEPIRALRQE